MIQRIRPIPDQCYRSERMPPGIGVIGGMVLGGLFWCPVLLLVKWAWWG